VPIPFDAREWAPSMQSLGPWMVPSVERTNLGLFFDHLFAIYCSNLLRLCASRDEIR
jgi:hypothetical protein